MLFFGWFYVCIFCSTFENKNHERASTQPNITPNPNPNPININSLGPGAASPRVLDNLKTCSEQHKHNTIFGTLYGSICG